MKPLLYNRLSGGKTCIILLLFMLATLAGCSPRIYRPPALGAEYQFDRGLPAAKKPSSLFDKRATSKLVRQGILHDNTTPPQKAPQQTGNHTRAAPPNKAQHNPPPAQPAPSDSQQQASRPTKDSTAPMTPAAADTAWQTKDPAAGKIK